MRVLIIEEKDVKTLLSRLELEKFRLRGHQLPEDEMHRRFHYEVYSWLQEQGY